MDGASTSCEQRRGPRDGWVLVLLAAWSLWNFARGGATAYDWPALDMAPYVARSLDRSYLENDFFTNASALPNPRQIYGGLLVAASRAMSGDWYAAMFLFKTAVVVWLPAMWYLALSGYVRAWRRTGNGDAPAMSDQGDASQHGMEVALSDRITRVALAVIVVGLLLVVRPQWANRFSIAWWSPFQPQATSANVALLVALGANVLAMRTSRTRQCVAVGCWAAATLLHPAIGLFAIAFHFIANGGIADGGRMSWKYAVAALGIGWLLPAGAIAWYYRPAEPLAAEEFIRQYVVLGHPSHYWPPAFGTFTARPWWHAFYLMSGILLAVVAYAAVRRKRALALLALVSAGAYVGCVALQYLAVIAWPNKALAAMGPVRFSMFGYYLGLLLGALVAGDVAHTLTAVIARRGQTGRATKLLSTQPASHKSGWPIARRAMLNMPRSRAYGLLGAATLVCGITLRDDPFARVRAEHPSFYAWIEQNTPPQSVFAAGSDLCVDLALVGRRSIAAGLGFPFREDAIAEHSERNALLYGTPEQWNEIDGASHSQRRAAYYRRLTPQDFARIAGILRLDYVIIDARDRGRFADNQPVYSDERLCVYAAAALR